MTSVNKTLYIPLYGKALVSKKGIILRDPKAEEIWSAVEFPIRGKSKSKFLAYYMGMRAVVFDSWTRDRIGEGGDSIIIHIGCGLDSRAERISHSEHIWYDVDFPDVINERKKFYSENENYRIICADVRRDEWLASLPDANRAIVIMEGVSMYLRPEELRRFFNGICSKFGHVSVLMDCYTVFAAKASKFKNPINDVGVTTVYGMDEPTDAVKETGLRFVKESEMTPDELICQLHGIEKFIFSRLYAGSFSKKLYRLYEYRK